jgi:hypothetical protein
LDKFLRLTLPQASTTLKLIDYNKDSFLDIVYTLTDLTLLYRGLGDGTFMAPTTIFATFYQFPAGTQGDINGDGYVDLVTAGWVGYDNTTMALTNNAGTGSFSYLNVGNNWPRLWNFAACLADFDNDGDLDLLGTGNFFSSIPNDHGNATTFLVLNSNQGASWQNIGQTLPQVGRAITGCADFDQDGWTDFFLTGWAGYVPQLLNI